MYNIWGCAYGGDWLEQLLVHDSMVGVVLQNMLAHIVPELAWEILPILFLVSG